MFKLNKFIRRFKKMSIKCDVCSADVTPNPDSDEIREYTMMNIKGNKVCVCLDCDDALYDYLINKKWKEDSEKIRQERIEISKENQVTDEELNIKI